MNIVKTESIYLSRSESNTFDKMIHILDGLMRGCEDIVHRKAAEEARDKIYEVWGMVEDVEMEDDCE